jgi:hypothetical protein
MQHPQLFHSGQNGYNTLFKLIRGWALVVLLSRTQPTQTVREGLIQHSLMSIRQIYIKDIVTAQSAIPQCNYWEPGVAE